MYECQYCHMSYAREAFFLKHKCKVKQRMEMMQSVVGQTAYNTYCNWMGSKYRVAPSPEHFMDSSLFSTFIKFAEFARERLITNTAMYVTFANAYKFDPKMWTNTEVYAKYLVFLDTQENPITVVVSMVNRLQYISECRQCGISEVLDGMEFSAFTTLLNTRLLTPWLLLKMEQFKRYYNSRSPVERKIINDMIDMKLWKKRFNENPQVMKDIDVIVNTLKL